MEVPYLDCLLTDHNLADVHLCAYLVLFLSLWSRKAPRQLDYAQPLSDCACAPLVPACLQLDPDVQVLVLKDDSRSRLCRTEPSQHAALEIVFTVDRQARLEQVVHDDETHLNSRIRTLSA